MEGAGGRAGGGRAGGGCGRAGGGLQRLLGIVHSDRRCWARHWGLSWPPCCACARLAPPCCLQATDRAGHALPELDQHYWPPPSPPRSLPVDQPRPGARPRLPGPPQTTGAPAPPGRMAGQGGFSFDLCKRNEFLEARGCKHPGFTKTGTTIAGIIYKARGRGGEACACPVPPLAAAGGLAARCRPPAGLVCPLLPAPSPGCISRWCRDCMPHAACRSCPETRLSTPPARRRMAWCWAPTRGPPPAQRWPTKTARKSTTSVRGGCGCHAASCRCAAHARRGGTAHVPSLVQGGAVEPAFHLPHCPPLPAAPSLLPRSAQHLLLRRGHGGRHGERDWHGGQPGKQGRGATTLRLALHATCAACSSAAAHAAAMHGMSRSTHGPHCVLMHLWPSHPAACTRRCPPQLELHRYATGTQSRVVTAMTLLKSHLFRCGARRRACFGLRLRALRAGGCCCRRCCGAVLQRRGATTRWACHGKSHLPAAGVRAHPAAAHPSAPPLPAGTRATSARRWCWAAWTSGGRTCSR